MKNKLHPWQAAGKKILERFNYYGDLDKLDRGVNFFVLALEKQGAKTFWSCEGHPFGFYIVFAAPQTLALKIKNCGYFNVELEDRNKWSLRLAGNEHNGGTWADARRKRCLMWAADAWIKNKIA